MKRAVVTGATSGIGEAIAKLLAAQGLAVTMVGRDGQRLDQARRRILAVLPDAELSPELADLSLLADVRALAARLDSPDVVVSNAAVVTDVEDVTSEGVQRILATNHLAPYLLMRSLVPARPARFVVVGASPQALKRVPVDLDDLAGTNGLGRVPSVRPFAAYGRTKNMNAMFVYALARRLEGTGITVNGAHPGIIRTNLGRNAKGTLKLFDRLLNQVIPGPEAGADTPAWLATAPEAGGITGRFFVKRKQVPTAPHTTDVARCDRLWDESARLVGLSPEL
jgi:NAD(P)-dependent dehydrogenase (short-subunit alcohol dehydrogenase family)